MALQPGLEFIPDRVPGIPLDAVFRPPLTYEQIRHIDRALVLLDTVGEAWQPEINPGEALNAIRIALQSHILLTNAAPEEET